MDRVPDLSTLSHEQKDALIQALWAQVQALTAQVQALTAQVQALTAQVQALTAQVQLLTAQVTTLQGRVAELETKLDAPPKTPGNSSLPPSQGKKPTRDDGPVRNGPRPGSLGRQGGGRLLAEVPV
jgi:transposase